MRELGLGGAARAERDRVEPGALVGRQQRQLGDVCVRGRARKQRREVARHARDRRVGQRRGVVDERELAVARDEVEVGLARRARRPGEQRGERREVARAGDPRDHRVIAAGARRERDRLRELQLAIAPQLAEARAADVAVDRNHDRRGPRHLAGAADRDAVIGIDAWPL